MWKKLFIYLLVYIISVTTFCACNQTEKTAVSYENTSLNSIMRPQILKAGNCEYYVDGEKDEYKIVKSQNNKTEILTYVNDSADYMNFYDNGNGLVYVDGNQLVMLNLKTKEKKNISEVENLSALLVKGNFAYCLEEYSKLVKIDIKTGGKTIIAENICVDFDVYEDYVYYHAHKSGSMDSVIMKKSLINNTEEIIFDGAASQISVQKDGIYFLNFNKLTDSPNSNKIFKIGFDNFVSEISEQPVYKYNISDDWIYYSNYEDSRTLYRMKKDGSLNEKVFDEENVLYIWIFEDTLYCVTHGATEEDMFVMWEVNLDDLTVKKRNDESG